MLELLSAPFYWNADPVLAHFGKIPIRWYTTMLLLGTIIAERLITRAIKRQGLPKDHAGPLMIYTLAGAILGAHLGHILFYEPMSLLENPARIFRLGGGLASHGAALGGVLGAGVMAWRYKVKWLQYSDITTFAFYWSIPLVRIGNFFNSEIYGRPTDLPWGVVFVRKGLTEPRHPSQLYEAILGVAFLLFCAWLVRRYGNRLTPGLLTFLMPGLYCITRFFIEFVKEYQALTPSFPLTMGQMLSVPVTLICGLIIWRKKFYVLRPASSPETAAEQPPAAS